MKTALMLLLAFFSSITMAIADSSKYVKVTTAPKDWSGDYLIVHESDRKAFDGSLPEEMLGKAPNTKTVKKNESTITTEANIYFTIRRINANKKTYSIKSASGFYIGFNKKFASSKSKSYAHTIELDNNGNVTLTSSSYSLIYHPNKKHFFYYKNKNGEGAITLYKKVHTSQVTIADCGYTTVCLPYNAKVQDGVQAFALRDVDEKGMHFSPVDTLIAGKGYVLQGTAGAEVELSEVLEPSLDTINIMSGVVTRTLRESITYQGTGEYAYPWILAKDGTFKRYVGEYIPAGKAYVDGALIQKMKSSAANAFRVIFEDETTGLSQLNEESKAPAYYYNLQGQRVAQPTRSGAIYIERGNRKFIVK